MIPADFSARPDYFDFCFAFFFEIGFVIALITLPN